MAIAREYPRQWHTTSTGPIVTASSGANFQFGFRPSILRLQNIGTVDLWLKFGSTGIASTEDLLIRACEPAILLNLGREVGIDVVSVAATTTAVAGGINIWALGSPE